jgi:hypothetical protein
MAGTIVANTLNTDTGVYSTNNAYSGIAKAFVNFNGLSGVSINSQFNVSSVTRNGTGNYTINFTTAMPNTNYAVCGFSVAYSSSNIQGASMVTYVPSGVGTYLPLTKSTTQANIMTGNVATAALFDSGDVSFTVFSL